MIANYHTHTWRCRHADGTEREYVETAIEAGFKILGFSDHTPQLAFLIIRLRCIREDTSVRSRCCRKSWKGMWIRFWT